MSHEYYEIFDEQGFCYDIEKTLCNTKAKLEFWVSHIKNKNWITQHDIDTLILRFKIDNPDVRI